MPTLEERVRELEEQVRRLMDREKQTTEPGEPWWMRHAGAFENDPLYDEAMRLGREYRRAQPSPADCPGEFTD